MYTEVEDYLGFLPYYLQEVVAEVGVAAALDMTYELTKPYTPEYYYVRILVTLCPSLNISSHRLPFFGSVVTTARESIGETARETVREREREEEREIARDTGRERWHLPCSLRTSDCRW